MPMIDAVIPEGALKPDAEEQLMKELTDVLLRAEGYDPANETAQSVSVVFLHRPAKGLCRGQRSSNAAIPDRPHGAGGTIYRGSPQEARHGRDGGGRESGGRIVRGRGPAGLGLPDRNSGWPLGLARPDPADTRHPCLHCR
jgi:phenylpyruvate tautomerase PptA (4-oxalocrotonate tautomerase family)